MVLGSEQLGVVGGANGVDNLMTGYSDNDSTNPIIAGDPAIGAAGTETGSLTYSGNTLFASNPTSIFTFPRPTWMDGATNASGNTAASGGWSMVGGSSADTILGNAGNDAIVGKGGADSIIGGNGLDSIDAGAGNDTIVGANDDALLDGGTDTTGDWLKIGADFTAASDNQIANIEKVLATADALKIDFSNQTEGFAVTGFVGGSTTFTGGFGNDTFTGKSGADSVVGGAGADSIVSGGGNDTLVGAQDDDLLDGGATTDWLKIGANFTAANDNQIQNIENVLATADALAIDLSNQTEGLDVTGFVGGSTTFTGGSGDDTFTGDGGADSIVGGAGADSIVSGGGNDTLVGEDDDALLNGGANTDWLKIEAGFIDFDNNQIQNIENVLATADALAIDLSNQTEGLNVTGFAAGATTFTGGSGDDTFTGGAGDDWIDAGTGLDSIVSGGGNDTLVGAQDDDLLDGGANTDWLEVGANFTSTGDNQIENIENVLATADALAIDLSNQTEGLDVTGFVGGSTTFTGGSGDDTFTGDNGADSIVGGAGADSIVSGGGNDTIAGVDDDALLDGGADTDWLKIGAGFTTASDNQIQNIEKVLATANALEIDFSNQTEGFDVTGFATGETTFVGGVGADTFIGGDGADSIDGGTGADNIDAGDGTDTIVFATALDLATAATVIGGLGNDTISIAVAGSAVADSNFDDVDTVEALVFTAGGNCLAILETEAQQAGIVSVFGGVGNDTFDASNAAYNATGVYFNGNGGIDSLVGGDSTDKFIFTTTAELNLAATVSGGNGNDTISLTSDSQAVLDVDFTDVLSVEALTFADGTGSSAILAGTANTAGIASIYGGSGNDTLTMDESEALYGDVTTPTFDGASGVDVLILSNDTAAVVDSFFTNMLSVGSFQTANGANDISLGVEASEAGIETITGGIGDDILNASAMTSAVTLMGGLGADTLTGGSAGNRLQGWGGTSTANVSNDTLTGGAGTNVFVLGDATGNAYGFDSNPAVNYRALITGFVVGTDSFQLWDADQSGAVTVAADGAIANQMNVSVGGLQVYRFNYDNVADTGTLYVAGANKVVAELTGFTGSGADLTTSHFTLV
jgi:Ca2+-binding RTX toxin-like protein